MNRNLLIGFTAFGLVSAATTASAFAASAHASARRLQLSTRFRWPIHVLTALRLLTFPVLDDIFATQVPANGR